MERCSPRAKVFRKTTRRLMLGIAKPLSRDMPVRNITLEKCSPRAKVFRRTIRWLIPGLERPLSRGMPVRNAG
ncbi:hypothetical protein D3C71_1872080 [compost metagenome]